MEFIMKITNLPEDMKMLYIYRYVSLLITSIFYAFGNDTSTVTMKIFMIMCLTASSIIFNYLYALTEYGSMHILYITIEIMGNILILIPTGGINSPFIWYSLNSILITVYFYNIYIGFIVLLSYQLLSLSFSQIIFHTNNTLFQMLSQNSNLLLSFILISIAAQLLLNQAKNLRIKSKDLTALNAQMIVANASLNDSIEQIMHIYQAVHTFVNLNNKDSLINLLIKSTKEITNSPIILFYTPTSGNICAIKNSNDISREIEENVTMSIKNKWDEIKDTGLPISLVVDSRNFIVISVNSSTKFYGVLGVELLEYEIGPIYNQRIEQLKFLASLSSIALEKFDLEELKNQLLVNEEQNRIANELHDSVSQRLFAISCGIFDVTRKTKNLVSEEVSLELSDINDSLITTIKELRKIIYDMSWNKEGASVFQINVKKYINDISEFYSTSISFNMDGNEEIISSILKNALYRIICEGIGNSARHGKSKNISVSLSLHSKDITLTITDDGIGFKENNNDNKETSGMGIENMHNLVYSLGGHVILVTKLGYGTEISVSLPNNTIN